MAKRPLKYFVKVPIENWDNSSNCLPEINFSKEGDIPNINTFLDISNEMANKGIRCDQPVGILEITIVDRKTIIVELSPIPYTPL
jgi:hypothetical protein